MVKAVQRGGCQEDGPSPLGASPKEPVLMSQTSINHRLSQAGLSRCWCHLGFQPRMGQQAFWILGRVGVGAAVHLCLWLLISTAVAGQTSTPGSWAEGKAEAIAVAIEV